MQRRRVLAALPVLLAGCSGITDDATDDAPAQGTTARRTTTATPTPATVTDAPHDLIQTNPTSMSTGAVEDALASRNCATLAETEIACPGENDRLDVSVSPRMATVPDAAVAVTITNVADEAFRWNPYNWFLQKWDGEGWRRVAPLATPAPIDGIPPGESHTYRVTARDVRTVRSGDFSAEREIVLGGLGPGVYGFSTTGHFESSPDTNRTVGTLFGLAGEAPAIRPTDAVVHVGREDSELVIRTDVPTEKRGTLVVSLVDGEPDARVLPDHVRQLAALLNSLPYAVTDGIERIRYVGNAADVGYVDSYLAAVTPDGTTRFGFRDLTFEIATE